MIHVRQQNVRIVIIVMRAISFMIFIEFHRVVTLKIYYGHFLLRDQIVQPSISLERLYAKLIVNSS